MKKTITLTQLKKLIKECITQVIKEKSQDEIPRWAGGIISQVQTIFSIGGRQDIEYVYRPENQYLGFYNLIGSDVRLIHLRPVYRIDDSKFTIPPGTIFDLYMVTAHGDINKEDVKWNEVLKLFRGHK